MLISLTNKAKIWEMGTKEGDTQRLEKTLSSLTVNCVETFTQEEIEVRREKRTLRILR